MFPAGRGCPLGVFSTWSRSQRSPSNRRVRESRAPGRVDLFLVLSMRVSQHGHRIRRSGDQDTRRGSVSDALFSDTFIGDAQLLQLLKGRRDYRRRRQRRPRGRVSGFFIPPGRRVCRQFLASNSTAYLYFNVFRGNV
eukprot:scaffold272427_cov30-Tisochrysis_lutea.AAC.2